jgi:hypothetical protein
MAGPAAGSTRSRMTDAVEKGLRTSSNSDSADSEDDLGGGGDDGGELIPLLKRGWGAFKDRSI